MPMSNFSNGFLNGVTIRGLPITQMHPGRVIHVNNSGVLMTGQVAGSDGNSGDFLHPMATIAAALDKCVASRGDILILGPGHSETISTATSIDIDVAGVAVLGMGVGSLRPTINITHASGFLKVSAANVTLHNLLLTGGVDAITKMLNVTAADVTLNKLELRDVTGQMADGILTSAAANRLRILDLVHDGAAAAGTNAAVALVGGDNIEITIKRMDGNFAVGGIDVRTTATTDLHVHDVEFFRTRNAADIFLVDTITASTGMVGPNVNLQLADNAANITEAVTGATFVVVDPVYVVNLAGEKAMLINWTASTDA